MQLVQDNTRAQTGATNPFLVKLFRDMDTRGDLPAISESVWRIVAVMDREYEDFNLTQAILDDVVLTQKVLRASNAAVYSRFQNGIHTVSQAVVVLGYDRIGHLALGLKLTNELLQAATSSKNVRIKDALNQCAISGTLARHLARKMNPLGAEAAAVCCMLRGVARIILMSYQPELWDRVEQLVSDNPAEYTESSALRRLIGLDLGEFSQEVARHWKLPVRTINSLADLPFDHRPALPAASNSSEWLGLLAHHCTQLRERLADMRFQLAKSREDSLADEFAGLFGLSNHDFLLGVTAALREEQSNPLLLSKPEFNPETGRGEKLPDAERQLGMFCETLQNDARKHSTRSLMGMVMESLMRIFGARRALLMRHEPASGRLVARMGQGYQAGNFLGRFSFEAAYAPDVFHLAIAQNMPVLIQDSAPLGRSGKLPKEYLALVKDAPPFLVLPVVVGGTPEVFLYLDWAPGGMAPTVTDIERQCLIALRETLADVLQERKALSSAE